MGKMVFVEHGSRLPAGCLLPPALADEVSYTFDDLGRLTAVVHNDGSMEQTLGHSFDEVGNITLITSASTIIDTDGDRMLDGGEVTSGTDPLGPQSYPVDLDIPLMGDLSMAILALLLLGLGMRNLPRGCGRILLPITLLFLSLSLLPHAALAAPSGPGWFKVRGTPVTPEEAAAHYQNKSSEEKFTLQGEVATQATPEIIELARGLRHDPKLIYEYVRNHVEYTPYFGLLKGATLTYLDGSGNDFDQASLLVALLRESGYSASFLYGQMSIPASGEVDQKDVQHWLAVDENNSLIAQVFANGGIPAFEVGPYWLLDRVWVQATINGTTYTLDPAFKVYSETTGIDVKTAMNYNRTALLQAAGGTVGSNFIQNLNEAGLRSNLDAEALNLVNYIRENYPNADMREIVGGREIVAEHPATLPTELPFINDAQYIWAEIPDTYAHKVQIVHGGINKTYTIAELAGKKLSLTYRAAGSGLAPASAGAPVPSGQTLPTITTPLAEPLPLRISPITASPTGEAANLVLPSPSLGSEVIMANANPVWNFGTVYTTENFDFLSPPIPNPNPYTIQLRISLINNDSGAYSIPFGGGTTDVFAYDDHTFTIRFSGLGQERGTKTAQVKVEWLYLGGIFSVQYVDLTGIVAYPLALDGYGMSGSTFLNEPFIGTCRLQNNGTLPLTIGNAMTLTGTDAPRFQIVSGGDAGSIPAGGYRDIQVKYLADIHAIHSAQVHVAMVYDGLSYTREMSLQGQTYYKPDLSGSSSGINFGHAYLYHPQEGTVRLMNSGTQPLTVDTVSQTGADVSRFLITGGNSSGTIGPGQYRDINVRYLADVAGVHGASVHVTFTYDGLSQLVCDFPLEGETDAPPVAQLWLDDEPVVEETEPVTATDLETLTISVVHPYPGPNGDFADQSVDYTLKRGSTYAIIYDFGGSHDGRLLEKRQRQMQAYRDSGLVDTSREVLSETLNVMGMTWMRDTTLNDDLLAQLAGVLYVNQHRFGIVAQETGYYIDIKAQKISTVARHNDTIAENAFFRAAFHLGSALEHGVLEQMQVNRPAVSTVKLLQLNNQDHAKTFLVTSANFATVMADPELTGYSDNDKQLFQTRVNGGNTLILPANGQVALHEWAGKGYIDYDPSRVDMIIGGDYFGGYGVIKTPIVVDIVASHVAVQLIPAHTTLKVPSTDPVDMASGAFLHDHADLAMGGGAGGLALQRSYNSGNNSVDGVLGYGWSHNYDLYAEVHSSSEFGLGRRLPVDAAAIISADVALLDLMSGTPDLKSWMVSALIGKWGMDQLTNNAVSLHLESDILTYVKLPDGTYSLPPGVTSDLSFSGATYKIDERFGRGIEFNSDNRVSRIKDVDNNATNFTYIGGKLSSVADGFGHALSFTYTGDLLTSVADSAGRTVAYGYDAGGNLTTFTDPETKVWRYGYDAVHRLLTHETPLAITTVTNIYDSLGRVKSQAVPRQSGSVSYDLYFTGYRNVEEDAAHNQTVYHFDGKKRLIAVEDALGHITEKSYDGQNHVTAVIDPRENSTLYQYDGENNLTQSMDTLNQTTRFSYDTHSHLTAVTDPLGHSTYNTYDSEHHPTMTITYPEPGVAPVGTAWTYYGNGRLQTSENVMAVVTTLTYDGFGNPATSKTANYPQVTYAYDAIGRMTGLTDQEGAVTSFVYDKRNLLTQKTDPRNKKTLFTYNDAGQLLTKTDRKNKTLTYGYTNSGKLASITYPEGSVTTYTYDQRDYLVERQDSLGITTFVPDAVGRTTSLTDPNGVTTGHQYDEAGNLTRLTYPGGKTVSYTYDAANRLKTVTIDWLGVTATYTCDAAGRMTKLTQFNGTVTTYGYDNANRLTSLNNRTAASGGADIATYAFTLDSNGNRTHSSQTTPLSPEFEAGSTTLTYNKNRLMTAGAATFGYDYESQLHLGYGRTFTFDNEHRLTEYFGAGGGLQQFYYDGAGNRLRVTRKGVTTRYVYDTMGNLIAEADANNVISRYYIHGAGLLAMVTAADDQLYSYHFDATGHTVALTDASKVIKNSYAYTPHGVIAGETEAITQPFKYAGQYGVMAEPIGFYYMWARYYDPQVGRFISEDPLGFDGGDVNLYAYVQNNPVNFVDPYGLAMSDIPGAIVTSFSGAANSLAGIARNGPPEAKALMAFSAATEVVPLSIAAASSLGSVITSGMVAAGSPIAQQSIQAIADFGSSYFVPGPPSPSVAGYAGSGLSWAVDQFSDKYGK